MKGPAGYGRYDDDPDYVGCPRARSDMTPCIARDGGICIADAGVCVACGAEPMALLVELAGETGRLAPVVLVGRRGRLARAKAAADALAGEVRRVTEGLRR